MKKEYKFEKIQNDTESDITTKDDISKVESDIVLTPTFSYGSLSSLVSALKQKKNELCVCLLLISVVTSLVTYHLYFRIRVNEFGLIISQGSSFPSKHQTESVTVREKYLKDIKSKDIPIPTINKLLIGIHVPATNYELRHFIRLYQIKPYNSSTYDITWRFILTSPKSVYREMIKLENSTWGDILILDYHSLTSISTFEFFKYIESTHNPYNYIAVMDSNSFINIPTFWTEYFTLEVQKQDFAMIALFNDQGRFPWPHASFQAVSWKLMLMVNKLYASVERTSAHENVQIAWFLSDAQVQYKYIKIDWKRSYIFTEESTSNPKFPEDPVILSGIKEETHQVFYLSIASCFTTQGINNTQVEVLKRNDWHV